MNFFDLFKPRWKHSSEKVRNQAIVSGKLKTDTLIEIVKNKEEVVAIRKRAVEEIKDEQVLASLVGDEACRFLQKDIIRRIKSKTILNTLHDRAAQGRDKKIIALLRSQIEAVQIENQKELDDESLIAIAEKNESYNKTREAMINIRDSRLLTEWLSNKVNQDSNLDYCYFSGFADATKKNGLEQVLPYLSSIKLADKLVNTFTKIKDQTKIYQAIADNNLAKEYLKEYLVTKKEPCLVLLMSLASLQDVLELTTTAKYDFVKYYAYVVAREEVMENRNYQDALINLIVSKNQPINIDVKNLLKRMGKDIVYNIETTDKEERCCNCNGTGKASKKEAEPCICCEGTGRQIRLDEQLRSIEIVDSKKQTVD